MDNEKKTIKQFDLVKEDARDVYSFKLRPYRLSNVSNYGSEVINIIDDTAKIYTLKKKDDLDNLKKYYKECLNKCDLAFVYKKQSGNFIYDIYIWTGTTWADVKSGSTQSTSHDEKDTTHEQKEEQITPTLSSEDIDKIIEKVKKDLEDKIDDNKKDSISKEEIEELKTQIIDDIKKQITISPKEDINKDELKNEIIKDIKDEISTQKNEVIDKEALKKDIIESVTETINQKISSNKISEEDKTVIKDSILAEIKNTLQEKDKENKITEEDKKNLCEEINKELTKKITEEISNSLKDTIMNEVDEKIKKIKVQDNYLLATKDEVSKLEDSLKKEIQKINKDISESTKQLVKETIEQKLKESPIDLTEIQNKIEKELSQNLEESLGKSIETKLLDKLETSITKNLKIPDNSKDIRYINEKINSIDNVKDALDEIFKTDLKNVRTTNTLINENDIDSSIKNNFGQCKINLKDKNGFLEEKIDNKTIQIKDNYLIAKTLDGLELSIEEMNTLKGLKESLGNGMEFQGVVEDNETMNKIQDPKPGYTCIVKKDSQNEDKQMFYVYCKDIGWQKTFEVSSESMSRNFKEDKIDLTSEVTGQLSISNLPSNVAQKEDIEKAKNQKLDKISIVEDHIVIGGKDNDILDSDVSLKKILEDIKNKSDFKPTNTEILNNLSEEKGVLYYNKKPIFHLGDDDLNIDLTNYYKKDEINVKIGDAELLTTAKDIHGAINELFIKSNSLLKEVAQAIGNKELATSKPSTLSNYIIEAKKGIVQSLNNKGVHADFGDDLKTYGDKINMISQKSQIKRAKLNIKTGDKKTIELTNPTKIENLCTTVLEYVPSEDNVVEYNCQFDNSDEINFVNPDFNPDCHIKCIDGVMKQKNLNEKFRIIDKKIYPKMIEYNYDIDKSKFHQITEINILSNLQNRKYINIIGTYNGEIKLAREDIDLNNVNKIINIKCNANIDEGNILLVLFSIDSGETWGYFDKETKKFKAINIENNEEIKKYGLTPNKLNELTEEELELMLKDNRKIRFAYYIERFNNGKAENDSITVTVNKIGRNIISKNVDYKLLDDDKTIEYTFNKDNTYLIVYSDND